DTGVDRWPDSRSGSRERIPFRDNLQDLPGNSRGDALALLGPVGRAKLALHDFAERAAWQVLPELHLVKPRRFAEPFVCPRLQRFFVNLCARNFEDRKSVV